MGICCETAFEGSQDLVDLAEPVIKTNDKFKAWELTLPFVRCMM